jgi:choline-glycine betaine transporter
MLGFAGAGPLLRLGAGEARWLLRCLLVTGYGNIVASIIGACTGARGLDPAASPAEFTVFFLFWLAIVAVFVALFIAARGALRTAR